MDNKTENIKPEIMMINIDWDRKCIVCKNSKREFILRDYVSYIDWKWVCNEIAGISISSNSKCGDKKRNKEASNILGMAPKRYAKMLNGAQYNLWINKEDPKMIDRLCKTKGGKVSGMKLLLYHKNKDMILSYKSDKLDNLLPIAMYFAKTTEDLKKEFGKKNWKRVCNNSFSRNKILCSLVYNPECELVRHLNDINIFPTTLLKKYSWKFNSFSKEVKERTVNILTENRALAKGNFEQIANTLRDTERMAKKLGKSGKKIRNLFNVSLKKLSEIHDQFSEEITAKKYSKNEIVCLKTCKLKAYEDNKYIANLITSPHDLQRQGREQHHCVASYLDLIYDGKYLVYDIKENRDEHPTISTLGVSICEHINSLTPITYRFSQHYKSCNQPVDGDLGAFSKALINKLNK